MYQNEIEGRVQKSLQVILNPKFKEPSFMDRMMGKTGLHEVEKAVDELICIMKGNCMKSYKIPNFGFEWSRKLFSSKEFKRMEMIYKKKQLWPLFEPMHKRLYETYYADFIYGDPDFFGNYKQSARAPILEYGFTLHPSFASSDTKKSRSRGTRSKK
jgi:hypothetical protein